ncbi:MAG: YceD family protein [Eubacterium sp.]
MQLDFTNLFNSSGEVIDFDYKINFDDFEYSTYKPLTNGAGVKGKAFSKADVVYLALNVCFDFNGFCDRCADEINRSYSFDLEKIIVPRLENNDDDYDNYVVVENNVLDLDDLVYQEIQLFLPTKMLCIDDCKGLCPSCGKNLNHEKCECKKEVDPRMAALLQLLDEE